jgi:hypothetical protein
LELVDAPGPLGSLDNQTGLLEQAQVSRHSGSADRKGVRELSHGEVALTQQTHDVSAVRISERLKRVPLR